MMAVFTDQCRCGRVWVQCAGDFKLHHLVCDKCPDVTKSWWFRLDEWQHRHYPQPGRGFYVWHWFWRPLCSYVEGRLAAADFRFDG